MGSREHATLIDGTRTERQMSIFRRLAGGMRTMKLCTLCALVAFTARTYWVGRCGPRDCVRVVMALRFNIAVKCRYSGAAGHPPCECLFMNCLGNTSRCANETEVGMDTAILHSCGGKPACKPIRSFAWFLCGHV